MSICCVLPLSAGRKYVPSNSSLYIGTTRLHAPSTFEENSVQKPYHLDFLIRPLRSRKTLKIICIRSRGDGTITTSYKAGKKPRLVDRQLLFLCRPESLWLSYQTHTTEACTSGEQVQIILGEALHLGEFEAYKN
jgi:hypothetical protein